jgi:hypothetical protein
VFYGVRKNVRHQPEIYNGPVLQVFSLLPEVLCSEDRVAVGVFHHGGYPPNRRRARAVNKIFTARVPRVHEVYVLVDHSW